MSQITYLNEPGPLTAGMKADASDDYVRSYVNSTGATIPYGIAVARGAADRLCKRVGAITDDVIGVSLHSHVDNAANRVWPQAPVAFGAAAVNVGGIPDGSAGSIMRQGRVWVQCEQAVGPDDTVFVRITANGAGKDVLGAFRKDADVLNGVPTAIPVTAAQFLATSTAAGVALLEVGCVAMSTKRTGHLAGRIAAVPAAEAANVINVVCGLFDLGGNAVLAATPVWIESFAVTDSGGDLAAASVSPVGTVVKAINPATGPNTLLMTSTVAGLFSFGVTNAAAEITDVRITADGCLPRVLRLTFA